MDKVPAKNKTMERIFQVVAYSSLFVGVYIVIKQGKQIEALLLFLIGMAAISYYWIKWFKVSKDAAALMWPPFISTCPDYLTLITPTDGSGAYCLDFVGISINPSIMMKSDPHNPPKASDPNFESMVFRLNGLTDPDPDSTSNTKSLCDSVRDRGLTWAHVCDSNV
jgi:hypothetical protein